MKLWPSICLDKKLLKLWRSIFHWWGGVKWKSNIRQSWFLGKCCNKNLFVVDWIKIEINACADHNCQLRRRGKPEVVWVPDTATAKSSKCLRTQSRSCLKNIATIKSARHSCQKFKILQNYCSKQQLHNLCLKNITAIILLLSSKTCVQIIMLNEWQVCGEPKVVRDVAAALRPVQGRLGGRLPHGADQPGLQLWRLFKVIRIIIVTICASWSTRFATYPL